MNNLDKYTIGLIVFAVVCLGVVLSFNGMNTLIKSLPVTVPGSYYGLNTNIKTLFIILAVICVVIGITLFVINLSHKK